MTSHPLSGITATTGQLALDWSTPTEVQTAAPRLALARPPLRGAPTIKRPAAPAAGATTFDGLNRCGRPLTLATRPGAGAGRTPTTKGKKFPPDPVTPGDVDALLKHLEQPRGRSENRHGRMSRLRLRATISTLWRTGLRISELLALEMRDLNRADLCVTVRNGKGGKRRIIAMDPWGWTELNRWLEARTELPSGPVFCVVGGVTAGQSWAASDVRRQLHHAARGAGVKRRVAPHQFRHAHAVDLWREDINVFVIQQQLGHARLDVTALYLRGIAPVEVLKPIGQRRAPLMPIGHAS
jgi:site-specific recombinase XerD